MKKDNFLRCSAIFCIAILALLSAPKLKAQNDILDECPLIQGKDDCLTDSPIEIPVNFDATGNDTLIIIDNISGKRLLDPTVPDKQYKFCAANSHFTCNTTDTDPGEFRIRFKYNSAKIGVNKISFEILNNFGGTITVTAYQGPTDNIITGIAITGGLKYVCDDNITAFDSIIIASNHEPNIDLESELFILDSLFIIYEQPNQAPTDISISSNTVDENEIVGTTVGSFSTTDPNAGDSFTYSLVAGAGDDYNSSFTIVGSTLQTAEVFDYETKLSYSVRIETDDGNGGTFTEAFSINITDLNDNDPVVTTSQSFSIAEDAINTTVVGTVAATDADAGTTFSSWTITGGNTDGIFTINSGTGVITVTNNSNLDYETTSSYTLSITVSDGINTSTAKNITINVTDIQPHVVCLMDLSGSMNWSYYGDHYVPLEQQRLWFAKEALKGFTSLYRQNFQDDASYGLIGFQAPYNVITTDIFFGMDILTEDNHNDLIDTQNGIIMDLNANGGTPLLAGIEKAIEMFQLVDTDNEKVIVLLSDGQHNCPGRIEILPDDIATLLDILDGQKIKVYTIGFGQPYEVDVDLLNALAYLNPETGLSGYYDVVDPDLPAEWIPQTALSNIYSKIFAEGCGFGETVDPIGIINQGETKQFEVPVSWLDSKICFFISWVTPQPNYLEIKIYSSNGTELPVEHPDIIYSNHDNYTIITISNRFLSQEGIVGLNPWKLDIDASSIANESENYQYLVLNKSKNLKLNTWFDKASYFTGDKMKVFMELLVENQRLTNIDKVIIKGSRPGEGLGNWIHGSKLTMQKLQEVKKAQLDKVTRLTLEQVKRQKLDNVQKQKLLEKNTSIFLDNMSLTQLKARIMIEDMKIKYPGRMLINGLLFNDEGTDGDETAEDGLYTAVYEKLTKEGTYVFNITALDTSKGKNIMRETQLQKYVRVKVKPKRFVKDLIRIDTLLKGQQIYNVSLTLKDKQGNISSPYALRNIKLNLDKGKLIGGIQANPDGTFTQMVSLPEDVKPKEVKMTMKVYEQVGEQRLKSLISPWIYIIIAGIILIIIGVFRRMRN